MGGGQGDCAQREREVFVREGGREGGRKTHCLAVALAPLPRREERREVRAASQRRCLCPLSERVRLVRGAGRGVSD
jgi:hypothetical protein